MFIQWLSSRKISKPIACSCSHWRLPFRFHTGAGLEMKKKIIIKGVGGVRQWDVPGQQDDPSCPTNATGSYNTKLANSSPKSQGDTPGTLPKKHHHPLFSVSVPRAALPPAQPHTACGDPAPTPCLQPPISWPAPLTDTFSFPRNRRRKLCSLPVIIKSARKWGRIENPHYSTS